MGILDNGKAKSDLLLHEVEDLLRNVAGVKDLVLLRKESPTARHRTSTWTTSPALLMRWSSASGLKLLLIE